MKSSKNDIKEGIDQLRTELNCLIGLFELGYDYDLMIYELWSAKDILGHIVFWHESFARNISDIGSGLESKPLRGKLSEINTLSVETTKSESIVNLIRRLKDAQEKIEKYIFNEKITLIPYKKGSRDYSKEEHLEVVANHIHKHLSDIIKNYGKAKK